MNKKKFQNIIFVQKQNIYLNSYIKPSMFLKSLVIYTKHQIKIITNTLSIIFSFCSCLTFKLSKNAKFRYMYILLLLYMREQDNVIDISCYSYKYFGLVIYLLKNLS
ncbi:hypothetical protein EDEG_03853 [Edhazardia aedis USNM 41457]|uniref:Uncharacterized protein n=1 Tax=Edhazardia aedis (strain USNM 41457) TaxID=1003232 RepID=J8ZPK1_EDHAE|nr:hypothetical protein EDEG_03853 [Edhazardia aedis USNM 41457]|eukprot:EJW01603.1 hypothetical protein EDEG_03853 [Edhazardia aedis USNM 41457]